jgi:polysaccharide biosynthesis/export protein
MSTSKFLNISLTYLVLVASTGLALSQADREVRKAISAPGDDEPAVEMVPRAISAAPKRETPVKEETTGNGGDTYKLRATDQLDIKVFGQADLSGLTTVREDGSVRLPLISEVVQVGGLTLGSVEAKIRALLAKDYLRNPQVSVNVSRYGIQKITVLGRVNQPKTHAVPSNRSITLVEAIGLSGGQQNLGNLAKVTLKRGSKVQVFNVEEMMKDPNAPSVELRDGDVVSVPERLW